MSTNELYQLVIAEFSIYLKHSQTIKWTPLSGSNWFHKDVMMNLG